MWLIYLLHKSPAYEFNGHGHITVYSHLLTEIYKKSLLYLKSFPIWRMSHNKGPFWKFNMEIMVPRSMSSYNIDYSHKTICIVCWQFKCEMFARKNATNITMRDGIFHHPYHDWPSCISNEEAMVTNNMWYSWKYASIWMIILRNHFHKPPVAEMWLDNKKYDWKLFFLVDFTSRFKECPSATNMIVIWTLYSDSFTPKTSH